MAALPDEIDRVVHDKSVIVDKMIAVVENYGSSAVKDCKTTGTNLLNKISRCVTDKINK